MGYIGDYIGTTIGVIKGDKTMAHVALGFRVQGFPGPQCGP